MKEILRRLFKFLAYTAAGIVIALAIAVGLFRLFLPRLPAYQGEIKDWASAAIGMEVEFSGMDARWGLSGPELEFYDAELVRPSTQARVIAATEVRVGVALTRLLFDRTLVVDRIVIRDTSIEVRQLDSGRWWVQGSIADDLLDARASGPQNLSEIELVAEDVEIIFLQPGDERPRFFDVSHAVASIDSSRIAFDADVRLPDDLGRQLSISAIQPLAPPPEQRHWDVSIEADDVDLAGWTQMQANEARRLRSGRGDFDLAVEYAGGRIRNVTTEVDLVDIALGDNEGFDISGRFAFNAAPDGWLVAAEEFQFTTALRDWPEASFRAEASTDKDGEVVMLGLRASYLNLEDTRLFAPWLTAEHQATLDDLRPSGVVRELIATIADIESESPRFDVAAELETVGVAAGDGRPGLRGFSGTLRANRLGGRLEIRSSDMIMELPEYLPEPVTIDFAEGTVIWRSSDQRTTVLSDSIRVRNDVFDSQSNIQLTVEANGASPVIDLASTWNITDISTVRNYIPQKILKPKLYDWFQQALVKGSIPRGATTIKGPLDKFPFENGEGSFLIDAAVRNLTFKYQQRWPAATQADMHVILDGTRLYSESNRSLNLGNEVIDAKFEIADLRDPVLTIDAFSTGTLETIRTFSQQSPIGDMLGGQLDRITVSGDASFSLDLRVPLKDAKAFEFTTRIRSNNGALAINQFPAQFSDIIGEVTISRDDISSEALGATFLGQPVTIELLRSEDPRFSVIANSRGSVTADALIEELGLPLDGLISGSTTYETRVLFPRGKQATPSPLTIQVESDLEGLVIGLPEPVGKEGEASLEVRGDIRFKPGEAVIESAGFAENDTAWQVGFVKTDDEWDLDRGVVTLGRDIMQPAETRGLHIRGTTSVVRLADWLSVSRSGDKQVGAADRIRSIDLTIEDLYAIGQHLKGHRVRVDRSARDWLVQIEGDDVAGSVFVPYDFGSERALVVEMERLRLPGDDESSGEPDSLDPRTLPPITLTASEFALGDRYLGAVDVQLDRIDEGLEAASIRARDDTFEIVGNARWVADELDPLGSRTYATATLTSTDVAQTMARLNFTPGIVSDSMNVLFDLSWSGGPRGDFLEVLDGEVKLRFGAGQLEEVDPGAGRVFGLMSIVALPRRLSLDFTDVFNKGFGFDKIAGTFRLDDGETYTCDLSLEGPAADIGIVGRASLVNRDYDQVAVVSANFGNTLPLVGAVVAGPQAAAAMLIFSQIFKKPLQEVGQVYYSIGGSWDDPAMERADSASFASHGELAGCIANSE